MAIGPNTYGEDGIRLVRIDRVDDRQRVTELTIDLRIEGDFDEAFLKGDGSRVAPAQALRAAVHEVAGERPVDAPEALGLGLADHLLAAVPSVRSTWVRLVEEPWEPVPVNGRPSPSAFLRGGRGHRTVTVNRLGDATIVVAGLKDLLLLQTDTQADPGTDPLLATALQAEWRYNAFDLDWDAVTEQIRGALLEAFSTHHGASPHHRLHHLGEAVLDACPQIEDVTLSMAIRHHLPLGRRQEHRTAGSGIFTATDRAFGLVQGTVTRS